MFTLSTFRMAGNFSSALKLTDLNDYLAPSQACIKPVKVDKTDASKVVRIEVEADGTYLEIKEDGSKAALKPTKISLNDCLACRNLQSYKLVPLFELCSGCVTTAETVLIEAQSVDEFTNRLADRETWPLVIVSLSPQSLASIATYYNLSMAECYQKLNTFFVTKLGVNYVFDTSFSRDLALLEQAEEFVQKYRSEHRTEQLPLLASSCPGWICYAEKSQGEFILPFISSTKSPQQIMGTLVKQFLPKILAQRNGNSEPVPPSRVLHVTVMPCFDKKLEASRDEFYSDVLDSHDVDLVLTSLEIPQLLQKTDTDFLGLPPTPIEPLFNSIDHSGNLLGMSGGSGGYLEFVFRYAAKSLFNLQIDGPLEYKAGRNADFKELILEHDGKPVLTFAMAYGFRNIQNIVRKIKSKQCNYDYIEIMACPSGCLNGGGQIKAEAPKTVKEVLRGVEMTYSQQILRYPLESQLAESIYTDIVGAGPMSNQAQALFHTTYHAVAKLEIKSPLTIQW